MKKKIIITLVMAFMATNIFAFQIGGTLGVGYGEVTYNIIPTEDENNKTTQTAMMNGLVLFPHKYGDETNWGGRVEVGYSEMAIEISYALTYTFDVGIIKITPFGGFGFTIVPLGGNGYAGCSFTLPIWTGDLYADIRYGIAKGIIYDSSFASINIGYIFKFGNDRN